MIPNPTMISGKLETRVTMRSSVLIWDAESSSMVAVYIWRERRLICGSGDVTRTSVVRFWESHLVDKHDGENCLVDELRFTENTERRRLGGTSGSTCCLNVDRVLQQQSRSEFNSKTYGKPGTLFRMMLSWALLQARMGTPVVCKRADKHISLLSDHFYSKEGNCHQKTSTLC